MEGHAPTQRNGCLTDAIGLRQLMRLMVNSREPYSEIASFESGPPKPNLTKDGKHEEILSRLPACSCSNSRKRGAWPKDDAGGR